MTRAVTQRLLLATTAALLVAACNTPDSASPAAGQSDPATTIVIAPGGIATPHVLAVPAGSQITFVNNDRVVHEMFSDPHPEHNECPEFDSVGRLAPGESRQTSNLVTVRTCNFHDHINPTIATLNGTIRIQ